MQINIQVGYFHYNLYIFIFWQYWTINDSKLVQQAINIKQINRNTNTATITNLFNVHIMSCKIVNALSSQKKYVYFIIILI